jgi:hypothetical protein
MVYHAAMSAVAEPIHSYIGVNLPVVREDKNQVYFLDRLIVAPNPSEQMLAYAYLEFERQGLNKYIWYEGVPSLSWYLAEFKKMVVLGCYEDVDGIAQIRGLGWVNTLTLMGGKFKKAEVGMAFFKEVPHGHTHSFGLMMVDHAITHVGLDAMFGATPVKNPAAIRYMQKLGFSHCGPVENYCSFNGELCACEISWMTREKWEQIRPFRVEKE